MASLLNNSKTLRREKYGKAIVNNPFQIKQSKNDLPIPIVNGVHLHSSYDPVKEAKKND